MQWNIHNRSGQRKYLTSAEVNSFARAAGECSIEVRCFCLMLAHSGCRISEALALKADNIDFETGSVVIKCLKKRDRTVFRAVPLPPSYLKMLRGFCRQRHYDRSRLWPWSRMTGYRRICEVMASAGIRGAHACPKGLRHAYGVRAIQAGVSLNLVQKWLGHADIKTTAIYTNAIGPEERDIAARMWRESRPFEPIREVRSISKGTCDSRDDIIRMQELDRPNENISSEPHDRTPSFNRKLASVASWRSILHPIGNVASVSKAVIVDQIPSCVLIHFWI